MGQRIGIDLVETARFTKALREPRSHFIKKVFSEREISYAMARVKPAVHFAGMFAAKEAGSKALGVARYPYIELEVRHKKDGAPELWSKNKKLPVSISITHTTTMAAAVAVR